MGADTDYVEGLARLAEQHQQRLSDALVTLEDRIADLMATAPLKDGNLFDLEWAIESRSKLRKIIEQDYLKTVDGIIRDYNSVAASTAKMLKEYGAFTTASASTISQLQKLTFQGFDDIGQESLDVIAKEVYQNTLTGRAFSESVKTVREAVSKDMARHAKQQVHDSLMQFDASINVTIGMEAGATKWKYIGGLIATSRQFCREREGNIYDIDDIESLWSGSWAGKASGDPFIVRGGFNCQHQWRPVLDDELAEEEITKVSSQKPDFGSDEKWTKLAETDGGIAPLATAVINKIAKPKSISSKGSKGYYQSANQSIVTPVKSKRTLLHEYGHHIDYTLGDGTGYISSLRLAKTAKIDAEKLGIFSARGLAKSETFAGDSYIEQFREKYFEKTAVYYKSGRNKGRIKGYTYSHQEAWIPAVSDIMDSMSRGRVQGKFYLWGHGIGYYSRGVQWQATENFANLFQLYSQGGQSWIKAKEFFPELSKAFEELLKEVSDGRIG